MTKWRAIPVALCAGSVALPAHALHIVDGTPVAGVISAPDAYRCRASWTPLEADPFEDPACPLVDLFPAVDPWRHAAYSASQGAASGSTAAGPADPGRLLAQAELDPGRTREAHGGKAAQLLAGLATVVVLARRRLSWRVG